MRAGRLRHQIQIQAVTRTSDGGGGATESWSTITNGTVRAEIIPTTSAESFRNEQLQDVVTHKIRMRYLSGVTTAHRAVFGSRHFHVRSVINIQEKNEEMILLAEEVISR